MSWQDFRRLIDQQNTDITAWMQAIQANPNTPKDALKMALLDIIQRQDMAMLDNFITTFIGLVRKGDDLLALIIFQQDALDLQEPVSIFGLDDPRENHATPESDLRLE